MDGFCVYVEPWKHGAKFTFVLENGKLATVAASPLSGLLHAHWPVGQWVPLTRRLDGNVTWWQINWSAFR